MGRCNKEGRGVVVPTITIFNENETVDYGGMQEYLDFLLENHVDALFAMGTTQENATFGADEYKELVRFMVEYVDGKVPVYIGVSSPATRIRLEIRSVHRTFQSLIVGADGWTAGIGNVFPEKCRKIWDTVVEKKDYEEGFKLWKEVLPFLNMTINKDFYGKSGRADWLQMYKLGLNLRLGLSAKVRRPLF
ncbi:dihydrodipicolinate synthase family protein [Clostridiales bacterium]|nr:dihydrodipicolinate synthase family protein [Clostridiales bacterium]